MRTMMIAGDAHNIITYGDEVKNRGNDFWREMVRVLDSESVHIEYYYPSEYLSSNLQNS